MKRIKFFIGTLAALGLMYLIGCTSQLDQAPLTEYSPATYYSSKEQALQGLYGVYDMLQKEGTYQRFLWSVVDGASDDMTNGCGDSYDRIAQLTDDPTTPGLDNGWIQHYQGISRANALLQGMGSASGIAEADRKRIEGEAKFLRALFHFNLVNIYGGVPVVTRVLNVGEYNVPRNSVQEVYVQLEKDCQEAIEGLPLARSMLPAEVGRATKGSAQALLCRAYLFQGKWAEAARVAKEIMDAKQYDLVPDYRTNFLVKGENGPESVFEVQYSDANASKGWAQEEGNFAGNWVRPGTQGGWAGDLMTTGLSDQNPNRPLPLQGFEPGDVRRGYTVTVPNSELPMDNAPIKFGATQPRSSAKHWSDPRVNGYIDPLNWIVFRYAEVLLNRAEALIEANQNLPEAQALINQLRKRAKLPETKAATQAELRDVVRHERRVELAFEMTRWWDLRRWGLLKQALTYTGKPFTENKREYFAIPKNQIDLSNGALVQNKGYE